MIHSTHRFHGRNSLRFVYQKGSTVRLDAPLALRFAHNPRLSGWRLAVVVSRKVSKAAVVRNRIRRRIFEIVRRESGHLKPQYDLVISVYDAEVAQLEHEALRRALLAQLSKAGVLSAQETAGHDIVKAKEHRA